MELRNLGRATELSRELALLRLILGDQSPGSRVYSLTYRVVAELGDDHPYEVCLDVSPEDGASYVASRARAVVGLLAELGVVEDRAPAPDLGVGQ
jgi:hypothetical protein